jgi:hypothetical protein
MVQLLNICLVVFVLAVFINVRFCINYLFQLWYLVTQAANRDFCIYFMNKLSRVI